MVNHDHPDEKAVAPSAPTAIPALTPKGASRRRIAGLGVSGVLMTVANSNAMADIMCESPSGSLSGTHSSHAPSLSCDGRSPDWWLANGDQFPTGMTLDSKFGSYFPTTPSMSSKSIRKVLQERGTGNDRIAALLMATYLNVNCEPKKINFITSQAVLEMWTKWQGNYSYQPAAGGPVWYESEFSAYLAQTQVM